MSTLETAAFVVHQVFAALWVGSVAFVTLAYLPLARDGHVEQTALETVVDRLLTLTRASAFVLLATGAYLLYGVTLGGEVALAPLLESGRGHLVATMLALWAVVVGTIEVGSSRALDGIAQNKLREPAHAALPFYRIATGAAVLVAGVAGLLGAGVGY